MWFKIDDTLWGHPKWLRTSPRARGLWVTAGSWSASQLTDGHIPEHVLTILGGTRKDANELVARGLWTAEEGGGWRFHDWNSYQPTRSDVMDRRQSERERKQRYRREKSGKYTQCPSGTPGGTPRGTDTRSHNGSPTNPSRPDPSRPNTPPSPKAGQAPDLRLARSADADHMSDPSPFDDFWQLYPRKTKKGRARTAWIQATTGQDATDPKAILDGLRAHLEALLDVDERYRPYPATWLADHSWEDDPITDDDPWAHLDGPHDPRDAS